MCKDLIISCLVLFFITGCCSKKVNVVTNESGTKSVVVWFEGLETNYFSEFTESNTVLELQNRVNQITDAG